MESKTLLGGLRGIPPKKPGQRTCAGCMSRIGDMKEWVQNNVFTRGDENHAARWMA